MYARPRVLPGKIQVFPWVKPGFQGKVPWRIPGNLVFTRIPGKSLVCHGIAEKPGSSPGFSQGESWETAAAARWKSLPFPSLIPGITLVENLVFGGSSGISLGFSLVEYQGFPSFFPGFSLVVRLVTKNLVTTRGKPGIPARATKPWYLPGENLGIYRFPREADKYQGKIGFPGFSLVKS